MDEVQKILAEIQRKLKEIDPYAPENDTEDEAYENGRVAMALYLREFIEHLEKPVSEELDKASKEWLMPQLDKSYANYGEAKMMELTHFDGYAMLDAIEFGANWKERQFEKNRLAHCDELPAEQAKIESDFVTQHIKDNNRTPTFIDAIEYGMRLHKEKMMSKAIDAVVIVDRIGEVTYLCPHTKATSDKAKVIIIEEEKL